MASQMMLFETETRDNGDGSFTLRPKAVRIEREIRVKKAAKILGYGKDAVRRLCELGEDHGGLRAYQLPSERGNAPWRIDWEFLMRYKESRQRER